MVLWHGGELLFTHTPLMFLSAKTDVSAPEKARREQELLGPQCHTPNPNLEFYRNLKKTANAFKMASVAIGWTCVHCHLYFGSEFSPGNVAHIAEDSGVRTVLGYTLHSYGQPSWAPSLLTVDSVESLQMPTSDQK